MAIFTNQATLTYGTRTVNSNVAIGTLLEDLAVTKTALGATYTPGDDMSYVVNVTNSGATAITNLTITDDMGGYPYPDAGGVTIYPMEYKPGSMRFFLDNVLQTAAPTIIPGPPMSITGITIPAGSTATFAYAADLTDVAPREAGSTITNTVTAVRSAAASASDSATITVTTEPELSINKSMSPDTVTENSRLTYTFLIQNFGNTPVTADQNVRFTDDFDPYLENLTVNYTGADGVPTTWTEGVNYVYTASSTSGTRVGSFLSTEEQITIPAAAYTRNADGSYSVTPGTSILTITGTV